MHRDKDEALLQIEAELMQNRQVHFVAHRLLIKNRKTKALKTINLIN